MGILGKFLRERRMEVLRAMTIDMTIDRRIELIREEEREEGREEGRREMMLETYKNCLSRGLSRDDAIAISGISEELLQQNGLS